jgi:methylenetetrahydrofolate reductase (NADPH)
LHSKSFIFTIGYKIRNLTSAFKVVGTIPGVSKMPFSQIPPMATNVALFEAPLCQQFATDILHNASIELTSNGRAVIEEAAEYLPPGTRVYLPKMPRETLHDKLKQAALVREFGFEPVPHIAARQLTAATELRDFLTRANGDLAIQRVLVIGGNNTPDEVPFRDSFAVISSEVLPATGITHADFAGYPDGHPKISRLVLETDLDRKLGEAARQGLKTGIVTQFSFDPASVSTYCSKIAARAPAVTVHAGIAGPTNPAQLLRYARICGVSTSLKAMNTLGINAVKLALNSSPERQLNLLAYHGGRDEAGHLAGLHLFSFGGFVKSAQWLRQQVTRHSFKPAVQKTAATGSPPQKTGGEDS